MRLAFPGAPTRPANARKRTGQARSQTQIPRLVDEVAPETVARLCGHALESGAFVEVPRRLQMAVSPQGQRAVTASACELHALVHQAAANAQVPCRWLDEHQPRSRRLVRLADHDGHTDDLPL